MYFIKQRHMKLNKSDKIKKKKKSSKLSLIIINVSWAANQYIKIISEGSCNTEDWSNACWKFSFDHRK